MDKTEFYTKGKKEDVISRIGQVHTITLFCPLQDFCVQELLYTFEIMLSDYKTGEDEWKGVPAIDALNAFLFTSSLQEVVSADVDKNIINIIMSSLKMFNRLKIINFKFTDDEEIWNTYNIILKREKEGIKKYIYNVDKVELNLSDMFSQRIIDLLNKVFICNELMSNSYLDRKFVLDFTYDEYKTFMEMFINNNSESFDTLDKNICEYFISFPKLIKEQKPKIRIITNYSN